MGAISHRAFCFEAFSFGRMGETAEGFADETLKPSPLGEWGTAQAVDEAFLFAPRNLSLRSKGLIRHLR